jgi:hypothetical protein
LICKLIHLSVRWHHILKGKFLHGKRNRRIDHLIHVLINNVVAYFSAKHHRQDFGFEGLDLEMRHRATVDAAAQTFPLTNITELEVDDEPGQFSVQSQSDPSISYHVDIETYVCDCPSWPLIFYCKHLAAVQFHFYDDDDDLPTIDTLYTRAGTANHAAPSTTQEQEPMLPHFLLPNPDMAILASIPHKLQSLALRTHLSPPQHLSDDLRELAGLLDHLLVECAQPQVLPKPKKVAPNKHSGWRDTTQSMGAISAPIKAKHKTMHTDPYAGGQGSGRKAKVDARAPLAKKSRYDCYTCFPHALTDYNAFLPI